MSRTYVLQQHYIHYNAAHLPVRIQAFISFCIYTMPHCYIDILARAICDVANVFYVVEVGRMRYDARAEEKVIISGENDKGCIKRIKKIYFEFSDKKKTLIHKKSKRDKEKMV